jgi:hypothetical protein
MATPDANFGSDLSLENDIALIGASGGYDDSLHHCGSAYVFRYDGASWLEEQKIFPRKRIAGDYFGVSVALAGNTALVGSYGSSHVPGCGLCLRAQRRHLDPNAAVAGQRRRRWRLLRRRGSRSLAKLPPSVPTAMTMQVIPQVRPMCFATTARGSRSRS